MLLDPSKHVICLMGPTACGKTAAALALAEQHPLEIISVDSALVYRDMNIGTAKPDTAELAAVPHHLIDICDPTEIYSAGRFRTEALALIAAIQSRGKLPLLVGGTMLYFHVLQQGVAELPVADEKIRQAITLEAATVGWADMHKQLQQVDPPAAKKIHPNDTQRIQRALEVYRSSGIAMSTLQQQQMQPNLPFECINIALAIADRAVLHEKIARRFMQMLHEGLVDEVEMLQQKYTLHADLPSMRSVGYRQVWAYLQGDYDQQEMLQRGIIATRQLAKRQFTWLRRWADLTWFENVASVVAHFNSNEG